MSNSSHRTNDRRSSRIGFGAHDSTQKALFDQFLDAKLENPELDAETFIAILAQKTSQIPQETPRHHGAYSPLNPNDDYVGSMIDI